MILLEEALAEKPARNGVYPTLCIDGRGASGKTSLAEFLASRLHGFTFVHGDDYFEPHDDAITWGDFNEDRFDADVLSRIRRGDRTIPLRPFDFPNGRLGDEQMLTVTRGLVIERWFGISLNAPWTSRSGSRRRLPCVSRGGWRGVEMSCSVSAHGSPGRPCGNPERTATSKPRAR